jgi:cytochrome P450
MGSKLDYNDPLAETYRKDVDKIKRSLRVRSNNPLFWFENFFFYFTPEGWNQRNIIKRLHKFTDAILEKRVKMFKNLNKEEIQEIKESFEAGKIKRSLPFLDNLLYSHFEQHEIDWEGVKEEMEVFMFAGHDTTTATSVFGLQFITENKEVLEKVLKEQDEIYGDSGRFFDLVELLICCSLKYCLKWLKL